MTTAHNFAIGYHQFLDADGAMTAPLPSFASDSAVLVAMHRAMTLTRSFDRKAIALQRTGQLGTFAPSLRHEAVGIGVASAMRSEDVLLPSYRDHGAQL